MPAAFVQEHPEYRLYRLQHMVQEYHAEARVEPAALAADPGLESTDDVNKTKCRRCRRVLVTNRNMLDHESGSGQVSFRWHKRDTPHSPSDQQCTSLFVEPMAWMEAELSLGLIEGKLLCCKCNARLGSYSWAGSQCSCGAWIVPSFQLLRKNVDIETQVQPMKVAQPVHRSEGREAMLRVRCSTSHGDRISQGVGSNISSSPKEDSLPEIGTDAAQKNN